MSSLHSNTMYSLPEINKNLTNGEMSAQLHSQQQIQQYSQQSQQQQEQQQQHQLHTQGLKMDKFLPPNSQNYRPNVSVLPSIANSNSTATINTTDGIMLSSSSTTFSPFSSPSSITSVNSPMISPQQLQQNQKQENNVSPMMKNPNNPITNGTGNSSTQPSRTASPALNKPVSNQFNSNSNNRNSIVNNIPRNYFASPSISTNSVFNQNQQSPVISPSVAATSVAFSANATGNYYHQNVSNLNDSIKNLSMEQNSRPASANSTSNVNRYQNSSPISSSNNYIPSVYQNNNFKMSALNNQPQQLQQQYQHQQQHQSQNSVDNYPYFQNSLLSDNENGMKLSPSSMNKNQCVPAMNNVYEQHNMVGGQNLKTPSSMAIAANYENRNAINILPSPSSNLPSLSRNENNFSNNLQTNLTASSSSIPAPPTPPPPPQPPSSRAIIKKQQHQQNTISNTHMVDNKPNIPLAPKLHTPSKPPVTSPYQDMEKPINSPLAVSQQQFQQQQYQQQQQQYSQQNNLQSQSFPPSSSASGPTFAGHPNVGSLKYPTWSTAPLPPPRPGDYIPSVTKQGFNKLWGQDVIDLMQHRRILPHDKVRPPHIVLNNQFYESVNCNPDIMRCTLNKIPESNNLLQKSRLPLGILVHPFRDINSLPVIQCPNIVRCRLCRAYINPFVYFVDSKMWKCNLCYRVNELPEDFQYDPATKTYGDVTRRPEVRSSTIEFIAPSEYMLRPPQPAIYLFLFDVSILAQQSGYLEVACSTLLKYIDDMPGDARTRVGFIAFNSEIHFYNIAEGYSQPHEMTLVEIDDPFLPRPDNLLVNLKENRELIKDLLNQLPTRFEHSHDSGSALGAVLQVAYKLMSATGGRVTVFQTCLPNKGPGALQPREDPNNRSSKDVMHLNPATDFYKRHALECSGYQIAVDLFVLNQQYCDLATISGVSKYSGGSIYHFPLYQKTKSQHVDALKQCLKRYLTRKIGFEAVMRIRCTRGLQVHTFHGNFFVRSTDLLSLPNVNPDAGYGMQISYEENLTDIKTICFQSALLYTNSEGERRIRVHTLCLPVSSGLHEVMHAADSQAIVSLLSKMAVDRCMSSSISDARDAFINATIDIINAFKIAQNLPQGQNGQLLISKNLSLLPLYISALLKHIAFRIGTSTRLDDRIAAMDSMKTLPLDQLMKTIYPEFYLLDTLFSNLDDNDLSTITNDNLIESRNYPPLLQLSAEYLDSRSMFLMDCGPIIMIYIGLNVPTNILENVLGVQSTSEIPDYCYGLQLLNTPENTILRRFIDILNEDKPYLPTIQIIRDTSTCRNLFAEKLIEDRSESSLSYYEFLQHLRSQIK